MTDTFTPATPVTVGNATKKTDIDKVYANTRYLKEGLERLHGKNLAGNPEPDCWSAGDTAAPDFYALSGAGAAIERVGVGHGTDTNRKAGKYSAKVTAGGGATAVLKQRLLPSGSFHAIFKGLYLSLLMLIRCGTASAARASLLDGAGTTSSAYHAGSLVGGPDGDGWEFLTCTRQIDASATELAFQLEVAASAVAWFGGAVPILSLTPPWNFLPAEVASDRAVIFSLPGTLPASQTALGGLRFSPPRPMIVRNVRLALGTAGSGDNIVEVKKNGTTMFQTASRPKCVSAATSGSSIPDATSVPTRMIGPADILTADLVSIVGTPADLTVHVDVLSYQRPLEPWLAPGDLT